MVNTTQSLVKTNARSHSTLGLFIAALLYLVCVSGSVVVFKEEIERWEQPLAEEITRPSFRAIEDRFNSLLSEPDKVTEHMYLVFPNESLPRYKIANENQGWYLNRQGDIETPAYTHVADLLSHLHTYLHLPSSFGIYVVSVLGVFLTALIISGFLSHPSIIKDAFKWRRQNSARLYQTDLHNRLSVWGAPFYVMISITGVYFGFVGILLFAYAQAEHEGNQQAVVTDIFGEEPTLSQQPKTVNFETIMAELTTIDPEGKPLFMVLHDSGTDSQFVEIYLQQPQRFLYSENHRFDVTGNYLGAAGFSDGSLGKQIAYSTYRLHFGLFSSFTVKLLYFILGMSLTVICVTGVNSWLLKRKHHDFVNPLWVAVVWGAPFGMIASAVFAMVFKSDSAVGFWIPFVACLLAGSMTKNTERFKTILLSLNAIIAIALIVCHSAQFGWAVFSPAARLLTVALLSYICVLIYFLTLTKNNKKADIKVIDKNAEIVTR